jgi:glyoxylase-like metal-dependent hydrolase (beta-lactamase superfamily II)
MMPFFKSIKLGLVNVFVMPCKNGYLLVDSGYPEDFEKIINGLNQINISIEQIRYLFLTHHHIDHCGTAAAIKAASQARIIAYKQIIPYLENGNSSLDGSHPVSKRFAIFMRLVNRFSKTADKYDSVSVDNNDIIIESDNSQLLRSIGIPAEILVTPGHTDTSLSIIFDNGDVICGDIAFNHPLLHLLGSRYQPIYIQSENLVFESWRKIISKGAIRWFPSHGKDFKNIIISNKLSI